MGTVVATKICPQCRATLPAAVTKCVCGYSFAGGNSPQAAPGPSTRPVASPAGQQGVAQAQAVAQVPMGLHYFVPDWMAGYQPGAVRTLQRLLWATAIGTWALGTYVSITVVGLAKDLSGGPTGASSTPFTNFGMAGFLIGAVCWAIGLVCVASAGALWMLAAILERLRRLG